MTELINDKLYPGLLKYFSGLLSRHGLIKVEFIGGITSVLLCSLI